ncbi:hypothetical protein Ahy_A04g017827 [Arachis hypogaea]|uniref:Uncharacterized protein n=1 Tax=Arachis hypogaea TaxID=3818 RepID=A0A445DC50_ARAHY|nr:hypothetical protein Ahy_A04g017827 [Arachis hypogaea]
MNSPPEIIAEENDIKVRLWHWHLVAAESLALTLQVSCNLKDSKELLERCLNARKVLLPNDHIQIGANLLRLAQVAMLDSSQHKKFDVKKVKAELDIAKDHVHNSIST